MHEIVVNCQYYDENKTSHIIKVLTADVQSYISEYILRIRQGKKPKLKCSIIRSKIFCLKFHEDFLVWIFFEVEHFLHTKTGHCN